MATLIASLAFAFSAPAGAATFDAAFLHAVEPGIGRTLAGDVEGGVFAGLDDPRAPRLMPVEMVSARLALGGDAAGLLARAEADIEAVRSRLAGGSASRELIDELDRARNDLLSAVTTRPRLDLVRDAWALRGLAVFMMGEPEAARRDFARVLESDPSYRPDPRLFPPEAREQMGRALMARTDSHWRVLCSADVAAIGRRLEVDYVVVAHLQDTGLVELAWRVDVFDVVSGRFVGETEVHFPDAAADRQRAAALVSSLVREVVPRVESSRQEPAVAQVQPRPETVQPPRGDPPLPADQAQPGPRMPDPIGRAPIPQGPSPAFEPRIAEPEEKGRRSSTGWIVAATIVALAAGGTAAYVGLIADPGMADLQINLHR